MVPRRGPGRGSLRRRAARLRWRRRGEAPRRTPSPSAAALLGALRRVPLGYALGAVALLARATDAAVAGDRARRLAPIGEALRIWAAGHLEKGREVTSTGPYAITRHPLYAGSAIMGAGLAVAANSVVVAVLVFAYLAVTITAAIRSEEAHLTDKFGGDIRRIGTARRRRRRGGFSLERARAQSRVSGAARASWRRSCCSRREDVPVKGRVRLTVAASEPSGYNYRVRASDERSCRAVSSVGRAPALHAGCHRFESCTAHHFVRCTAAKLNRWEAEAALQRGDRALRRTPFGIRPIRHSVASHAGS